MKRGGGGPTKGPSIAQQRRNSGPLLAELSNFQKPEVCINSSSLGMLTLRVKQIPFVESKKGNSEKSRVEWWSPEFGVWGKWGRSWVKGYALPVTERRNLRI